MSAVIYAEVQRLAAAIDAAESDWGNILLDEAALKRNYAELSLKMMAALNCGDDSSVISDEVKDMSLDFSILMQKTSSKESECAALCSQYSKAIGKLIRRRS